jgi:hypothetical protein
MPRQTVLFLGSRETFAISSHSAANLRNRSDVSIGRVPMLSQLSRGNSTSPERFRPKPSKCCAPHYPAVDNCAATNNCCLNFQARQCPRPKLSPATHVRGASLYSLIFTHYDPPGLVNTASSKVGSRILISRTSSPDTAANRSKAAFQKSAPSFGWGFYLLD